MLLSQRTAKIGNAINTRAEMHGDESITALDIPLTDIMLDADELNAIMREPHAHYLLFNHGAHGSLTEPLFKHVKPLALAEKIEGAAITITHGVGAEVLMLANVKLAKIKLEPKVGGLTAMSCTVQCTPDLTVDIAHLLDRLNSTVDVYIDGGEWGAQQDLPLNTAGVGEQAEVDDEGSALHTADEGDVLVDPLAPPPKARGRRGKGNGQRERVQ